MRLPSCKARERLDADFQWFCERVIKIENASNFIRYEIRNLWDKYRNELETFGKLYRSSAKAILCYDLRSGECRNLGIGNIREDKVFEALLDNLNLQYCLQLVSVFEAYRSYLIRLFGSLGFINPQYWDNKELEGFTPNQAASKDESWFRSSERVIHHYSTHRLTERIRKIAPSLERDEVNFKTKPYIDVWVQFVEMLRHVIVHNFGTTKKRDEIIEKAFSRRGRSPLDKGTAGTKTLFKKYFTKVDGVFHVSLIERVKAESNFDFIESPAKELTMIVTSHAQAVHVATREVI